MDEEILKNIWNTLTNDGATTSDFETWKSNFSGSDEIQNNVHSYLTDKNYTKNNIETWRTNVGIKKKDFSNSTSEVEVMESTTETEANPGSLDSSSIANPKIDVVEEEVEEVEEFNFPDAPNREGVLNNEDGSVSTHKMRTESDGKGNWFSFPTIFQNENGGFVDMSEQAEQDWESVYEEASQTGC